jgi:uncharacterized protein
VPPDSPRDVAHIGRLNLGLYNSYDPTRFTEAHRRALARAGAVASAFEANLVSFGFPFKELAQREGETFDPGKPLVVARWVADSTSIGSDGEHFVALAEQGRFHIEELPRRGFPPQYGSVTLATSRVAPEDNAKETELVAELAHGRPMLLVIGLGPHGFPRRLERHAKRQWDLTRKQVSLETCTAMGAAPAILHALLHQTAPGQGPQSQKSEGPRP